MRWHVYCHFSAGSMINVQQEAELRMQKMSILIALSDRSRSQGISRCLVQAGYQVNIRATTKGLYELLDSYPYDLLMVDYDGEDHKGSEILHHLHEHGIRKPVILLDRQGSVKRAVEAIRWGASDYLLQTADDNLILQCAAKAIERHHGDPITADGQKTWLHSIITCSESMHRLMDMAGRIAPASATVLIQGESGTGKELLARFIHARSGRDSHPFVAMNCAALPDNLAESELFGYEKGAFTGAYQAKQGKFELAHTGTLLLDDISEMSLALQAKVLRVLQEKEVDRLGSRQLTAIDTRVIATTNRDLGQMVRQGLFREDLYYRLRVIPLMIPALRERREDIPLLVNHFIRKFCLPKQSDLPRFDDATMAQLMNWPWPGNVRELENTVERAVLIRNGPVMGPDTLLLENEMMRVSSDSSDTLVGMTVKDLEKKLIQRTLSHVNHNRTHAAEMLGISIRTLRNKLHEYQAAESAPTRQSLPQTSAY